MAGKRYLVKIKGQTAKAVRNGRYKTLKSMSHKERSLLKSISCDNGGECKHLSKDFPELDIYFIPIQIRLQSGGPIKGKTDRYAILFISKGTPGETTSDEKVRAIET
jgi:IS30 family transposase